MGKAVVIAAIVLGVALVLTALVVVGKRLLEGPTVRRRELARSTAQLNSALRALDEVEAAGRNWHEVDSVLAGEVGRIIREHKERELKLRESSS